MLIDRTDQVNQIIFAGKYSDFHEIYKSLVDDIYKDFDSIIHEGYYQKETDRIYNSSDYYNRDISDVIVINNEPVSYSLISKKKKL